LNYKEYVVKHGFVSDGVSSGCFLSNFISVDTAVMHDFLYATHPDTKDVCDSILKPCYRKCIVDIFGESAWDYSGKRGALVVSQTPTKGVLVTFTIYHTADYQVVDQTINLSESESKEFETFFEFIGTNMGLSHQD
jgi:hypothetical protein